MRAVRLTEWRSPPRLERVPVPVPRAGELLVEVRAAGICGSDRFGFGKGQRGLEPVGCGLGRDGGLADFLLVPSERYLVRAAGLDPTVLAPLADAGLTAYHAVRSNRAVLHDKSGGSSEGGGSYGSDGSVALVIGAGGLGHLAIQVLRAITSARVVAVDTNDEALELAMSSGADAVTGDLARARGLCLDGGGAGGADLVLDFVGVDDTLDRGSRALARGGRLVIVGSGGGVLRASKSGPLPGGWTASAPFWGTRADLQAVVDLARRGELRPHVETFPLGEAADVYRRLREGRVRGRAVLVP